MELYKKLSNCFPKGVCMSFYTLVSSVWVPGAPHPCQHFVLSVFNFSHSNGYMVIWHSGLICISIKSRCSASFYIFVGWNVYSNLLPILKIRLFSSEFWEFFQYSGSQSLSHIYLCFSYIFSPSLAVFFIFQTESFGRQKFLLLMKSKFYQFFNGLWYLCPG